MPSKPTIAALAIALATWAVRIWDWVSRENSLQAWINANHSTPAGSFVETIVNWAPAFLVVALLLWWHDARTHNLLKGHPANSSMPQSLETGLLRARAFAEKTRDDALQESAALRLKWLPVTSLVVSYVRVVELIPILEDACEKMNARLPARHSSIHDVIVGLRQGAEENEKDFSEIRPRLVQVMTEMRATYGLLNANLTDEKLGHVIAGAGPVRDMIEGLNDIALKLRGLITDAAIKAVDYKK